MSTVSPLVEAPGDVALEDAAHERIVAPLRAALEGLDAAAVALKAECEGLDPLTRTLCERVNNNSRVTLMQMIALADLQRLAAAQARGVLALAGAVERLSARVEDLEASDEGEEWKRR